MQYLLYIDLIYIFLNSQFQQLQEQVSVDVYFYHLLKNFSCVSHYLKTRCEGRVAVLV